MGECEKMSKVKTLVMVYDENDNGIIKSKIDDIVYDWFVWILDLRIFIEIDMTCVYQSLALLANFLH